MGDAAQVCRRPRIGEFRRVCERLVLLPPEVDAAGWFADVLTVLAGSELATEELPAWVADPWLPADLCQHWRSTPLSPWRPLRPDEDAPPPNVLAGTWLAEFADLYGAGAHLNMTPRDVDGLEMWEFAAALGEHRPVDKTGSARAGRAKGDRDIVAERIAHAQGKAPRPEPERPPAIDPRLASVIPIRGKAS